MSYNWSIKDLGHALKKIDIPVHQVRVRDIVFCDGHPVQIAHVEKLPNGRISLLDEDDNGGDYPPDSKVRILPRTALAAKPYE